MWGQDGWRSHRLVSYRARYLRFRCILFFCAPLQARILFETFFGVEEVEPSPRSCAKEFRHLGWAPLFYHNPVSQVGTCRRSAGQLRVFVQAYHTPSSVWQAAVQLLSHPLLSHPQTHPVGVRTCYHTPFLPPPLMYHIPKHTLWVFGRPITPPGLSHPPWAPCELHFITRGTQDITPPHRIPHPVIIFLNPTMLSPGCVILCQLR